MSDPTPVEGAALRASYDTVADEYARRFDGELAHKPFDRARLDAFAARVQGAGPVADLGCGPGHVAAYLRARGADACGVDLSPAMVARARVLHPDVAFRVGDLTALDVPDAAWAGAVASYSLIHVPRARLAAAAREIRRVLRAGAPLFVGFHVGSEVRHLDEWWGHAVDLDFTFYETAEMADALAAAGFAVEAVEERAPYPDVEVATRRGYVLASAR